MDNEVTEFYKANGLNISEDKNLIAYQIAQSEDVLTGALVLCERDTRKLCPNAKLLKIGDKHGNVTHIGVYDLPLTLTNRHSFVTAKQYSPQLLSSNLIEYREQHLTEALKFALELSAWASALHNLRVLRAAKQEMTLWTVI